jgi:hypothetical protein
MKKGLVLFLGILALSGCTTYKIQKGIKPYDKGYVVARRGFVIPEFTVGEDNTVPDSPDLAKERFERRRKNVEYYYEKLGDIDSNFKSYFLKPGSSMVGLVTSPFRLPVVAYQDHKYKNNAAYREKMDKIEDEADKKQRERIKIIKDYLDKYIQDDLAFERQLLAVKEGKELPAPEPPSPAAKLEEKTAEVLTEEAKPSVIPEEQPVVTEATKPEEKPAEIIPEQSLPEAVVEEKVPVTEKPVELAKAPETSEQVAEQPVEEKPVEAEVAQEQKPAEAEVAQEPVKEEPSPEVVSMETKQEEVVSEEKSKEEVMSEELTKQEEKPKKVGLWGKLFKKKEKPAKIETAEVSEEKPSEEKPKKSLWQKMFKKKEKPVKPEAEEVSEEKPAEEKPKVSLWQKMFKKKEKPAKAPMQRVPGEPPVAVIVAKPAKGYSPLKVHFSASRSHAIKGKIISYEWDFGDGDKSKRPSTFNTFYSGSFDPRPFTVTLTIQDDKGNIGTTTQIIEVLNK